MAVDFTNSHPAMDPREHMRTYAGFIRGAVVLTVFVTLILTGMLVFLT